MPRRRSRTNKRSTRVRSNTNRSRLRSSFFNNQYTDYNNRFVESRRTYAPTYTLTTKRQRRGRIIQTTKKQTKRTSLYAPLPFSAVPEKKIQKSLICAKRQQRKEVIHATRKAGQRGQRSPRRSPYSNIKC